MKEGWEYKKLGDIGTFIRGGNFSKKDFVENGFPCIHYGQIHMKFGVETLRNISSVPAEMVKNDRCAKKGDLVIAITSEDDAGSCKCTAWMGDYDVYVGGHTAIYRHTMQPKYVSYYFMSPYFQKDKLEYTHGFKVVEISPKDIAKISIPVPPLSEQQSIVDYLDSAFAKIDAMKANAEKALNEAKALFQASLKEMLEPKEGWEEQKIKEICETVTDFVAAGSFASLRENVIYNNKKDYAQLVRTTDLKSGFTKGGYVYVNEHAFKYLYRVNLDEECIILPNVGVNCGEVYYVTPSILPYKNNVLGPNAVLVRSKNNNNHFLSYLFLGNDFQNKLSDITSHMAQPKFNKTSLKEIVITVPPLSEQQSIVDTLDSLKSKVDRLQANYDKISQECDALKQAILRQVFE